MKQELRKFFAQGLRFRRAGSPDVVCSDERKFVQWAVQTVALAGPVGRLP